MFQVTYNLAREPYFEKSDGHALSSCREYKEIDYDDCIDDSLATEMGEIFNCTMPFLRLLFMIGFNNLSETNILAVIYRPDSLYEECRLDLISEEARRHILDKYQGNLAFILIQWLWLDFYTVLRKDRH